MEGLQLAISETFGIPKEKYQAFGLRSAIAEIPLSWLKTSDLSLGSACEPLKSDSLSAPCTENEDAGETSVLIIALSCEELHTSVVVDNFMTKSFFSTFSFVANSTQGEVYQKIEDVYPDRYRCQLDCECTVSVPEEAVGLCEIFLKSIFSAVILHPSKASSPSTDSPPHKKEISSANLKQPHIAVMKHGIVYLVYPRPQYTVRDSLMYSPCKFPADDVKTSFILFQILQFFQTYEQKFELDLSSLSWDDVEIDALGWALVQLPEKSMISNAKDCRTSEANMQMSEVPEKKFSEQESLSQMLDMWLCSKISNFDYLMFLNRLAGRTVGDPNHHPILPWVSTLETETASWRDLTKTKYRLTKGDRQLDIQYSMMTESAGTKSDHSRLDFQQVSHHVPEFLSDITFYVYMARRTPKSTLCKLVRSYWEPNEYPASIQRMQEWTPDECIPEFYTDSTIFESLHEDMCDLAVPNWCEDAADFIKKHRAMLESDVVSRDLHHWIDVTFGHKLSGKDAIEAKNVCLSLVDGHTDLRTKGITQLFDVPHPQKRIARQRNGKYEATLEEPDANNLLDNSSELYELEKLLNFKVGTANDPVFSECLTSSIRSSGRKVLESYRKKRLLSEGNMKAFLCLLVELYLPLETRAVTYGLPIETRLKLCIDIFVLHRSKLPSPFRFTVEYFIESLKSSDKNPMKSHYLWKSSSQKGHPAPSAAFLSSSYIHILPFPEYFHEIFELLDTIMTLTLHFSKPVPLSSLLDISEKFQNLLEKLHDTEECLTILVPYICKLLQQDTNSSVGFLVMNFESIAKALGKKNLNSEIFPLILRLYELLLEGCGSQPSSLVLELYAKKFLLQLYTRLGLKTFFRDIPRCLADALIHKSNSQISETSEQSIFWLMDRIGPTLTSKYIIRHLFRVLSICFSFGNSGTGSSNISQYKRVRNCLLHAAELFGFSVITLQYFPYLIHSISSAVCHPKFALRHQAAVESSIVTVSHLVTYLSDNVLMQELSRLSSEVLIPVIELLGRSDLPFPGGIPSRKTLCLQVIHLMALVVVRIGREMSRKYLTSLFRTFFGYFVQNREVSGGLPMESSDSDLSFESFGTDGVNIERDIHSSAHPARESTRRAHSQLHRSWFNESPSSSPSKGNPVVVAVNNNEQSVAKTEILSTFCAETAYRSYVAFTRLLGGIHMEKVLGGFSDHVRELSIQHERTLSGKPMLTHTPFESQSNYHADITMVGNQLVVDSSSLQTCDQSDEDKDFDIMSALLESSGGVQTEDKLGECARRSLNSFPASQLTENWLAYWEHEIGLPDNDRHIHFNQIELQSFSGHSSAVRCMCCHPSEDWFVSGGRDKTVRLWSVPENIERTNKKVKGNIMTDCYTYRFHKKSISYVGIVESEQLVISNDGNIHVWDPYTCRQLMTFDNSDVKSGFALVATLPLPYRYALTVTSESDLRIMDFRHKFLAHEFKITIGASMGQARAMCVLEGGNRVAIGFSTGMVSTVDVRMGNRLAIRPAHEADISAMVAVSEKRYLTASSDPSMVLWESGRQTPVCTYRSFQEPIHTAEIFNNEIISGSVANRISIHALPSLYDSTDSFVDKPKAISKLRGDTFRGVMTTFCVLPMKRQLLLASDNGSIKLMA